MTLASRLLHRARLLALFGSAVLVSGCSKKVTPPPPPPPPRAPAPAPTPFEQGVHDAYFDFDKADIRPDVREALSQTAEYLKANSSIRVTIEGHCDERGSTEYNLGLGDRRAAAVKEYLDRKSTRLNSSHIT